MIWSERARRSRACSGVTVPPFAPSISRRSAGAACSMPGWNDAIGVSRLRPSSSFHEMVGSITVPWAFRNAIVSFSASLPGASRTVRCAT